MIKSFQRLKMGGEKKIYIYHRVRPGIKAQTFYFGWERKRNNAVEDASNLRNSIYPCPL